jgi:hypothetical protein
VFLGFSRIFLLGILIFIGLTARRLYKSFGFKGLSWLRYCDAQKKLDIKFKELPLNVNTVADEEDACFFVCNFIITEFLVGQETRNIYDKLC